MNKLNVTVNSGISADGFSVAVVDEDEKILEQKDYAYGYDCSYDRRFADGRSPYVTDVLQGYLDRYGIHEVDLFAGRNLFNGKEVPMDRVRQFKDSYCQDLEGATVECPADVQEFADAVAAISEPEEMTRK